MFRTLIDEIERAIRDRRLELKANLPSTPCSLAETAESHAKAERQGADAFSKIPVIVTFANRKGVRTTLEYQLTTYAFAELKEAELEFVAET